MAQIEWHKDNRPGHSRETAIVNGKNFKTILIDGEDGQTVQRFRPNRIVRDLVDAAREGKKLDLNDLWIRAARGAYCKAEMHQLYRLIGYSICGFSEVFEDDEVDSSMWKKNT
jgi:hypothetical protein